MYFNGSEITRKVNGSKTESDGGFLIKRFYLGVDHKFNNVLSGNITTDVDSVGSTNGSLVGRASTSRRPICRPSSARPFAVRLGSTDMPWIPYVEGIYGYRYVENTVIDRTSSAPRPTGASMFLGDLAGGIISYQFSVVDGAAIAIRSSAIRSTSKAVSRPSTRASTWPSAVIAASSARMSTAAPRRCTTATRFDALVAYKDKRFTAGAEYFSAKNWTQVNSAPKD